MAITPPTPITVRVREGQCLIIPSNAKIISAMTYGNDPTITSADCPQLAIDIEDKLDVAVNVELRFRDAGYVNKNWVDVVSNVNVVSVFRVRDIKGGGSWNLPNFVIDISSGDEIKNTLNLTGTPYEGLIKYTGSDRDCGGNGNGCTLIVRAKAPKYLIDTLVFDATVSCQSGCLDAGVIYSVMFNIF